MVKVNGVLPAFAVFLCATCSNPQAAVSPVVEQPHIQVSLLSDVDAVAPGSVVTVGLHLDPDEDWHVYWRNPGDSGMAPKINWQLPEGVSASEIHWPFPEKIPVEHLLNYGYHKGVVLPVDLAINPGFAGETLDIKAATSWLVCQEICIPGKADLALSLPVGKTVPAGEAETIGNFKARHPPELPLMDGSIKLNGDKVEIELYSTRQAFKGVSHVDFFSINENLVEYNQAPKIRWNNNFISISQVRSASLQAVPEVTEGVLVVDHSSAWYFRLAK